MGKPEPSWKKLVNRPYVKAMVRSGFIRASKGDVEVEIGVLVNDLCRYLASELLSNTRDVMNGIKSQLDDAAKFMGDFAEGIDDDILRRRVQAMEEEAEEDGD